MVFWKCWYSDNPVLAGWGIATVSIALKSEGHKRSCASFSSCCFLIVLYPSSILDLKVCHFCLAPQIESSDALK